MKGSDWFCFILLISAVIFQLWVPYFFHRKAQRERRDFPPKGRP